MSVPKPRKASAERVAKMMKLRRDGLTLETIGEQFGITRQRVHQILVPHERECMKMTTRKLDGSSQKPKAKPVWLKRTAAKVIAARRKDGKLDPSQAALQERLRKKILF